MDLAKLERDNLEEILCDIIEDLDAHHSDLSNKYRKILMETIYGITDEEAIEIVHAMVPYGEVYTMDEVEALLRQMGKSLNETKHYYLCMNMFNNDYRKYPESKRLDIKEFCYSMADMFINDEDAPMYKVERYFKPLDD